MKTQDAIKHFGSIPELARALGVTVPAIYQKQWQPAPPWHRQLELQVLTQGSLKADPKPPPKKLKPRKKRKAAKAKRATRKQAKAH